MKKLSSLFIVVLSIAVAASAWAAPFNANRPFTPLGSTDPTPTLQTILNNTLDPDINAVTGQSNVALWNQAEFGVSSYLVELVTAAGGTFGVYSSTTGVLVPLLALPNTAIAASEEFLIDNTGTLLVGGIGGTPFANFGQTFGFYWQSTTGFTSFTEDSRNDAYGYGPDFNIMALSYLIAAGVEVTLPTGPGTFATSFAEGNNDWIIAFEDNGRLGGGSGGFPAGDGDFNDAVFYIEDISAVPEPATMLLFGIGLIGLGKYARRRYAL